MPVNKDSPLHPQVVFGTGSELAIYAKIIAKTPRSPSMTPGTTMWPAAPVALGLAEVVELDSEVVEVGGTTVTEVKKLGLPVAVRMPVSEGERVGAVMVLLANWEATGPVVGASTEVVGASLAEVAG
jgi:hypothetical protein